MPLPARSGFGKRVLRLLEIVERSGATPRLLAASATEEALADVARRGWPTEVFPLPAAGPRGRILQHLRQDPQPANPGLVRRLRELSAQAAWIQFEGIEAAQNAARLPAGGRVLGSMHDVESSVQHALARSSRSGRDAVRLRYRGRRMAAVERRLARDATALLCTSEADRRHYAALGADAVLAPNGVDDAFYTVPAETSGEHVLFFGAFGYAPNVDGIVRFLEQGWPLVRRERPEARLRIAGAEDPGRVRAVADGVPGVDLLGFVGDLVAEVASARLVIVPIWAGGGTRIKVLESLAAARPVVGTPVGVEEVGFAHDRHGLVAPTPEGLAEATVALLGDPGRARSLGLAGRALVAAQRWAAVLAPAAELYGNWLAEPPSGYSPRASAAQVA